jgi:hypothetical protein
MYGIIYNDKVLSYMILYNKNSNRLNSNSRDKLKLIEIKMIWTYMQI